MKRIGFAAALTMLTAVGVSAQTGGAITVVTSPDLQTCVVSGAHAGAVTAFRTTDANGTFATTVTGTSAGGGAGGAVSAVGSGMMVRTVSPDHLERVGSEIAVTSFARGAVSDASGVQKFSMTRSPDGTITVVSADGKEIPLTKDSNGVVTARTTDGVIEMHAAGVMVHSADAATAAGTVVDSKESPKYHVKRPLNLKEQQVEGHAVAVAASGNEMRARILAADGVALAKPAECKVIVRDGGNN